jgi:hypothetical protein
MGVYATLLPTVFVVAGFDAGRFGWSAMPDTVEALGCSSSGRPRRTRCCGRSWRVMRTAPSGCGIV